MSPSLLFSLLIAQQLLTNLLVNSFFISMSSLYKLVRLSSEKLNLQANVRSLGYYVFDFFEIKDTERDINWILRHLYIKDVFRFLIRSVFCAFGLKVCIIEYKKYTIFFTTVRKLAIKFIGKIYSPKSFAHLNKIFNKRSFGLFPDHEPSPYTCSALYRCVRSSLRSTVKKASS